MAPAWLQLLDDTVWVCAEQQRPDLVRRLRARRALAQDRNLRVLVAGAAGQGKSQLINALIGAPVCATGDGSTTRAPAIVSHAETPAAAVITDPPDGFPALETAAARKLPVSIGSVSAQANKAAADAAGDVVHARIGLPRGLLAGGLVLIDSPPPDGQVPSELLAADAVLLISDATHELAASEIDLLQRIGRDCPTVLVVLTKIDLVPGWRAVAERNRARLANAGIAAGLVPVSATLRLAAGKTGDRELNAESGFAELIGRIRHWLEHGDQLRARAGAALISGTIDDLMTPLHRELAATGEIGATDALRSWHAIGAEVETLQRDTARCQTVLSDEIADLISDLEYDLRDRTRRIMREAEEFFDAADPTKTWAEFEDWLQENLIGVAGANFGWLLDRFDWIATHIMRQFAPDRPDLARDLVSGDGAPRDHATGLRKPKVEKFSVGQQLFVGLRGSYSGLLMFGLATTVAGMPLINPISLGAGAAFGAKSVFEERGSRLKRRQALAKTAAQRHIDDFFLSYGKESKDVARQLHRALRDRFTEYAQQRRAELTASAKEIKQVIDADSERRGKRAREIRAGLETLTALRRRAQTLGALPDPGIPAPPTRHARELTA